MFIVDAKNALEQDSFPNTMYNGHKRVQLYNKHKKLFMGLRGKNSWIKKRTNKYTNIMEKITKQELLSS